MLQEYSYTGFSWGASGHAEVLHTILSPPSPTGKTHTFVYVVSNATNAITVTFNFYDNHGALLYQKTAIAKNATTIDKQEYVFMEGGKLGIDPSGDAGAGGITVSVYVYYDDLRG